MGENNFAPAPTALYGVVLLAAAIAYWILQRVIIAEQGESSLPATALAVRRFLTDGMVHVTGLCLALIGIIALTVITCKTGRSVEVASIVVYAAGLLAMLGFSAAYLWPLSPRKWLLRRFDQSAIFVFIAATYTPFIVQMKSDMASLSLATRSAR